MTKHNCIHTRAYLLIVSMVSIDRSRVIIRNMLVNRRYTVAGWKWGKVNMKQTKLLMEKTQCRD